MFNPIGKSHRKLKKYTTQNNHLLKLAKNKMFKLFSYYTIIDQLLFFWYPDRDLS